jgi:hypothetical protein
MMFRETLSLVSVPVYGGKRPRSEGERRVKTRNVIVVAAVEVMALVCAGVGYAIL